MNKEELIQILEETGIPFNEALSSEENKNQFPRIVFWEYIWEDVSASDQSIETVVTYQISLYNRSPRHQSVLDLKNALNNANERPTFYHEFIEDKKEFHTYLSIEVLEEFNAI